MNRSKLIQLVAEKMRVNKVRKLVSTPRHVFHISDDEGNCKDFVVRKTDKQVLYTTADVKEVLDTCIQVIKEALQRGEPISIPGFGTLEMRYRKKRATKIPGTEEWVDVDARYVPKFSFGSDLRACAKMYEMSLLNNKETNEEGGDAASGIGDGD